MSKPMTPEIRLAGFDDEWKTGTLADLATINPACVIPDSFQYVDLASVIGTSLESHRLEHRETAPSRAQRVAQRGDIFYQTVRPYQRNNYLFPGSKEPFVFSTGYAQIRPSIDSHFLFACMERDDFLTAVMDRCTGTSFPAIAPTSLGEIAVTWPEEVEEQQRIGAVISNLSNSLGHHRKKHRQIQQIKDALMQRMFPREGASEPEVRFAGFTGSWQRRPLGATASEFRSGDFISADRISARGAYPVFGGNGLRGYTSDYNHDGFFALVGRQGALCGNVTTSSGRAYFTEHAIAVQGNAHHDTHFLAYLLGQMHLGQYSAQSAQPGLAVGAVKQIEAWVPPLEEQQAIGQFFANLDDLIAAEGQYVAKLQQVKSALLQKMFV